MTPSDDFAFIPLGGTGEIGMNLNVYRCDGKLLAVDCGIGFAGNDVPGVDILVPDPAWLVEHREDLLGLVITHAHEDHIGGVAHLWRMLRCPVHGGPFVSAVLRRKLAEAGLSQEVPLKEFDLPGRVKIGPFDLQFLRVAHSVPEALAMAIRTRHGLVVHTGDWKLDPEPLIGPPTDETGFRRLGEEGVLAIVCDSTNAMVEGHSGSEAEVRRSLAKLIKPMTGRVAVTCFATNLARVESIALAGLAAGRDVALFGRSLRNAVQAARECGYLSRIPDFISEEEAGYIPDDNLLVICTGSQGEERSALAKLATDTHNQLSLGRGDTVIFSSRQIPGNERAITRVQDELARRGVRVITADEHFVHVSGHPAREELRALYDWVKPRAAIPVHGEWRHMDAHAGLARQSGSTPLVIEDGDVVRLAPGPVQVVDTVPVGRLAVDGTRLLPLKGGVLGARGRLGREGAVVASLALDAQGKLLGAPRISAPGVFDPEGPELPQMADELVRAVNELPKAARREEEVVAEAARAVLRKAVGRRTKKRPNVEVHLLRV